VEVQAQPSAEGERRERLELADGRFLDVYTSGPPDGTPLLFHHGTPGARAPVRALERAAHQRGLSLVSFSRPGYEGSTRRRGRKVADVVDDADAVLAALGASRCLVGGWSGGGPHALACAARLERAAAAVVVAGVAPYGAEGLDWTAGMGADNVAEFAAALSGEDELFAFLESARAQLEAISVEGLGSALASLLAEADQVVLGDEFGEDLLAGLRQALRGGVGGWFDDDMAFLRPWGFELDEITVPVALWHGSADVMVPPGHGRWLAGRVPGASVHFEEGEGHLSLLAAGADRIVEELVAAAS
jgi:pimeloyl-ACP methyl ester carboxylesterase